jgi:glycosyltransferase involved in cell wall biosynthesis
MKLGICCNFSHDHIGGSEIVIKNISETLVKNYGYEIDVYSFSVGSTFRENSVNYFPCKKGESFISQINKMDHVFVYSDSFWEWETIVKNIDKIKPDITVALVGMYFMRSRKDIYDLFLKNIDRYRIVVHNKGEDYRECRKNNSNVDVIPNGVDLHEFDSNHIDFRKKYNIKEKHIILNVAQFFYGKGQESMGEIFRHMTRRNKIDDFRIVSISSTVKYPYEKRFLQNCKNLFKDFKCSFLRDIPRQDVVSAFKNSDVFLFTSRKEVAPLVILEAQAAGLPWVSMNVGDVSSKLGGIIIDASNKDMKGYKIIDFFVMKAYMDSIAEILNNDDLRGGLKIAAKENILKYDWSNICPLYDEVFKL